MTGLKTTLSNFFLPPLCASCHAPVAGHENLCADCWKDIDFICAPYCHVLGIPLPFDPGGQTVSAAALQAKPEYDRARAVARYTGVMRKLIHAMKYSDKHESTRLYGRWMNKAATELLPGCDLIIPVPLNRLRLWSRRFNQASLLADALACETNIDTAPLILTRNRPTRSQVGLTLSQRRTNVSGAFTLKKSARPRINGANILLVDDVITTGATIDACARTLKKAGAKRVDVIALARVTNEDLAII